MVNRADAAWHRGDHVRAHPCDSGGPGPDSGRSACDSATGRAGASRARPRPTSVRTALEVPRTDRARQLRAELRHVPPGFEGHRDLLPRDARTGALRDARDRRLRCCRRRLRGHARACATPHPCQDVRAALVRRPGVPHRAAGAGRVLRQARDGYRQAAASRVRRRQRSRTSISSTRC